ncbi:hypothetical protein EU527_02560 [Candidatus Thorarchaeota archaeon]|nr:MAG: hypothetical protein EU527_02560 [Candidatus Thorarchaeota archaeon]
MRKRRQFLNGAKYLIAPAFLTLIVSILIALSNRVSPLPWNPLFVIFVGFLGFIIFVTLGSALIWIDTSWGTPFHRQQMPYEPDDNTVVRVVTLMSELSPI